jgi:2-polyprenyl-3-methyl-5-hydroxy-6-metoxy-1,4-benzoquinol methylase
MKIKLQEHWDKVYKLKADNEVSWFEPYPTISMELVDALHLPLKASIIDIGGGGSHFTDALLDKGYQNIWVLDISVNAIERAKARLGEKAAKVHWMMADITDFKAPVQFDLWHDRAAFHFLTTEDEVTKYVSIAERAIKKNGHLIMGTFSESGPEKCSGLEIKQYSEASLSAKFEAAFNKMKCFQKDHTTPFHTKQNFLFCSFSKK